MISVMLLSYSLPSRIKKSTQIRGSRHSRQSGCRAGWPTSRKCLAEKRLTYALSWYSLQWNQNYSVFAWPYAATFNSIGQAAVGDLFARAPPELSAHLFSSGTRPLTRSNDYKQINGGVLRLPIGPMNSFIILIVLDVH